MIIISDQLSNQLVANNDHKISLSSWKTVKNDSALSVPITSHKLIV
jgi:hypothetical protein